MGKAASKPAKNDAKGGGDEGKKSGIPKPSFWQRVAIYTIIIVELIAWILLLINGNASFSGCVFRYGPQGSSASTLINQSDHLVSSINVEADGNYAPLINSTVDGSTTLVKNPATFAKLKDTNFTFPTQAADLNLDITGEVSLCKAKTSAQGGGEVEIPRVGQDPLSIPFDSSMGNAPSRSLTLSNVFARDKIQIFVDNTNTNASTQAPSATITTNCSPNVTSGLSPYCNRFTFFKGTAPTKGYISSCNQTIIKSCALGGCKDQESWGSQGFCRYECDASYNPISQKCTYSRNHCRVAESKERVCAVWSSTCLPQGANTSEAVVKSAISYEPIRLSMPGDYNPAKLFALPTAEPTTNVFTPNYTQSFRTNCDDFTQLSAGKNASEATTATAALTTELTNNVNNLKFWLVNGQGLTIKTSAHSTVKLPQILQPLNNSNLIYQTTSASGNYSLDIKYDNIADYYPNGGDYFDYFANPNANYNIGGYVIKLAQTQCVHKNAYSAPDGTTNSTPRGAVKYYVAPSEVDLNAVSAAQLSTYPSGVCANQAASSTNGFVCKINANVNYAHKKLWLMIENVPTDYMNSTGQYEVKINSVQAIGVFSDIILNKILGPLNDIIKSYSDKTFKQLTCHGQSTTSNCIGFFTYIKALLTIYVTIFGIMVLLGKSKFNNEEIVKHIIKIVIVSGLMNGTTYKYFSQYVFGGLDQFSNVLLTSFGNVGADPSNPSSVFIFLDDFLSKVFFSKIFLYQKLTLITSGLTGLFFYLLLNIAIYVFVIEIFFAIAAFILSKFMLAFLLGIAPLFLTFILFDVTKGLFDKWINKVFYFIIEPIVLIIGIQLLLQFFMVALDNALGYSVCFKCAIPIKMIPIISSVAPDNDLLNLNLFCLNWWAPWGVDSRSFLISLPFQEVIMLLLIAYISKSYRGISMQLVSTLTGGQGMSATDMAGDAGAAASAVYSLTPNVLASDNHKDYKKSRENLNEANKDKKQRGNSSRNLTTSKSK